MSRHYEKAENLFEEEDINTQKFIFNQTMLRIKDPKKSLDFYTRIMGMKLYRKIDFPEMEFTLYFLGMPGDVDDKNVPENNNKRTTWTFKQRAMLELTHNWGTEKDENGESSAFRSDLTTSGQDSNIKPAFIEMNRNNIKKSVGNVQQKTRSNQDCTTSRRISKLVRMGG